MTKQDRKKRDAFIENLIAPCGLNCSLCWGYIRKKNSCPGCLGMAVQESQKSRYRSSCKIRNCEQLAGGRSQFCSASCEAFPCARLKQLDKRYRKKAGLSLIDNLKRISEGGLRRFLQNEKVKWSCPECGAMICIHKPACLDCGARWTKAGQPDPVS